MRCEDQLSTDDGRKSTAVGRKAGLNDQCSNSMSNFHVRLSMSKTKGQKGIYLS